MTKREDDSVIVGLSNGSVDFQGAEVPQEVRGLVERLNVPSAERLAEVMQKTGVSFAQATASLQALQEVTGPQLRAAGVQLHVDRLRAEFEAPMTTRRARLVWWLAGLLARRGKR